MQLYSGAYTRSLLWRIPHEGWEVVQWEPLPSMSKAPGSQPPSPKLNHVMLLFSVGRTALPNSTVCSNGHVYCADTAQGAMEPYTASSAQETNCSFTSPFYLNLTVTCSG